MVKELRKAIIARNNNKNSLAAFARRFRIMDRGAGGQSKKGDGECSTYELHIGLKQVGIDVDKKGCEVLLNAIDTNNNGSLSFDEFIIALRGDINPTRMKIIKLAFDQLRGGTSGSVTAQMMAEKYDVSKDPDVIAGKQTPQEAIREFMECFEGADTRDGVITEDEFIDYYKNVSASVDEDDYFELVVRNAWHISGGSGWSQNTTCLRVLVTDTDGVQSVVEVKNDLGLNPTDMRAIKMRLRKQGITNIYKVSTYYAEQ